MIEKILSVVKIIAAILPFVLLCLANAKTNLPKSERSRQYPMPIVTLLYSIVAMLLANKVNTWLIRLISNIPKWIASLATIDWIPNEWSPTIEKIAEAVRNFIASLNLNFWIFFISNVVLMIAYLIVKKIAIGIINKAVKNDGEVHCKVAPMFYEYFQEKGIWCVQNGYSQVRGFFKTFYYASVVISCLLMLVSSFFYLKGLIAAVFYPIFVIILIGELYFYLDGLTKAEYTMDVLGEDEDAHKIVNYSMLRKFLRSVFGDKLLTENTSINQAMFVDMTTEEIIAELEKSEDPKEVTFASYFSKLNASGFNIDHNYLYSSLEMLNGRSVLFNNPFFNDLIPYAFYPMNRVLLQHQKVLVVLGRHSVEDDIKEWLERGIGAITNVPFMWNIGVLGGDEEDIDIGIINRSDLLDIKLHQTNSDFLEKVGFVVILEPSKLISTAQIGLNILVKKCMADESKKVVFCLCDKNCDGLVDAMSHALMTDFTEVSATKKHSGTSSYMCWESDGERLHHRIAPNVSRYLGIGTELSFAALKNQVSETEWFGGENFPVTDMRWIAKQYYYELTRYANLPATQESMDKHFVTTPNFWSATVKKNSYLTVEDESSNMFEILRDFSTRTSEQGFINIISNDYLMKEYMADNASIFEADAKAIPHIVADYTRSNRNTVLRLILMLSTYPVNLETLIKEFSLIGIKVNDIKKQLWYEIYCCYSNVADIAALPDDYDEAINKTYSLKILDRWDHSIINCEEKFSLDSGRMEMLYFINDEEFIRRFVSELRSAGYICEDEKGNRNYLGAELTGQVYQRYLPGQFFTFGGKYYEMQHLTADGQFLVRRAADHIVGRPSYRQIRTYTINGTRPSDKIGAVKDIDGMIIVKEFADIHVTTSGYYNMESYNNFSTARRIIFNGEKNGIPARVFYNKEILRIDLPSLDGRYSDNIRYTITLLFNEIFKTLFAENQAYISAVTDLSFMNEAVNPLTYSIDFADDSIDKNSIYIIEDSQLDLGLIVAVERNLERIFGMLHDYLDWHIEQVDLSLNPPVDPKPPIVFKQPDPEAEAEAKKNKGIRGFFRKIGRGIKKIWEKIKGWFKKKPKKGEDPTGAETPVTDPDDAEIVPLDGDTPTTGETPSAGEENGVSGVGADENSDIPTDDVYDGIIDIDEIDTIDLDADIDAAVGEPDAAQAPEAKAAPTEKEKPAKKGWLSRIFGKKDKKKKDEEPSDAPVTEPESSASDITEDSAPTDSDLIDIGEIDSIDVSDVVDENAANEDTATADSDENIISSGETMDTKESPFYNETVSVETPESPEEASIEFKRKPYHQRHYLLYGSENESPYLDVYSTLDYLSALGFTRNALKQTREGKKIAELIEQTFKPGKPDARYCDFCGAEIYGVEYETLADGRDRCINCGRSAIKTGAEFKKLFDDVKRNMEAFYGIRLNVGVKVEMVNSKTLHKRIGKAFLPTPKTDGRVLGVAIKDKNGYSLLIENGSPRMSSMLTIAHELTHIWQYENWNDKHIAKKYGKNLYLQIYEGMAKWVEIQYAYLINEPIIAKREEIITSYREDDYGFGFLRYRAAYPFSQGTVITKPTPFLNKEEPLGEEYCGEFTVTLPGIGVNRGDIEQTGDKKPASDTPHSTGAIEGLNERDPATVIKYAYSKLSSEERGVYDLLLEAIRNFEPEVSLTGYSLNLAQLNKIVDFVQRDNPEIFWFNHGATFFYPAGHEIVERVALTYCMSKQEAHSRKLKIEVAEKAFLTSVNPSMSDYEVVLHIFENIINLVDYDNLALESNVTVSPEKPDDLRSIYGVFVNRRAVCVGYSKAMQYLLNKCGIECTVVTSDTHAWNLIKLEREYYHLDVTWGDGSFTKGASVSNINYDCFCITTEEVLRLDKHIPEAVLELPNCTAVGCNYHRRHGLFIEKYERKPILSLITDSLRLNNYIISFKFGDASEYRIAKEELIAKQDFANLIPEASNASGVGVASRYAHSVNDSMFTITLYMSKA